jgi:hypothetical protein
MCLINFIPTHSSITWHIVDFQYIFSGERNEQTNPNKKFQQELGTCDKSLAEVIVQVVEHLPSKCKA